ncbi:tissue factor pathway inhibitor [Elysia marginata]|uniref:Tissue factor pathway inhibitor n=1 Tax=Elysia marginata TaxID=1093978 RepID=A0AAV4EZK5_9GAST|nr:tissue factor pathway inhibitor [Elysia marginata]
MFLVTAIVSTLLYLSVNGQQPNFCRLPSETGNCRAAIPRYFYDTAVGKCRQFTYGGCGGNANNFATLAACRATCTCTLAISSSSTYCNSRSRRRYAYVADAGTCRRFRYSGCDGNGNNFQSRSQCNNACATAKCYLPSETGRCRAAFQRYFYNPKTEQCEVFIWGGCGGNTNNFRSERECEEQCASRISPDPTGNTPPPSPNQEGGGTGESTGSSNVSRECLLPKVVGRCRAAFPRYFYNRDTRSCERFVYGGCSGNANNFRTLRACQARCTSGSSSANRRQRGPFRNGRPLNSTDLPADSTASIDSTASRIGPTTSVNKALLDTINPGTTTIKYTTEEKTASSEIPTQQITSDDVYQDHFILNQSIHVTPLTTAMGTTTTVARNVTSAQEYTPAHQYTTPSSTRKQLKEATTSVSKFMIDDDHPDNKTSGVQSTSSKTISDHKSLGDETTSTDTKGATIKDTNYEENNMEEICQLPKPFGPCESNITIFAFRWASGRCKPFVYGGCQGNANVFPDRVSCMRACKKIWNERSNIKNQTGKATTKSQEPILSRITSPSPAVLPWFPSLGLSLNLLGDRRRQIIRYVMRSNSIDKHLDMKLFRKYAYGLRGRGKKNKTMEIGGSLQEDQMGEG